MSLPPRRGFRPVLLSGLWILGMVGAVLGQADFPSGTDNFADATAIDVIHGRSDFTILENFTQETGEPGHRPNGELGARRSGWWKWTAPETGFCTVDTRLSVEFTTGMTQTCLSVYRGTAVDDLTRVASGDVHSFDDFHSDSRLSSVIFHAVKGVEYYIAADSFRTGTVSSTRQGVVLQVKLFPFRKIVRRGSWQLLAARNVVDLGSIHVTSTGTGRLTGKFITTTKTYSFTGAPGSDGRFTTTFDPPQAKAGAPQELPTTLILDLTGTGGYALYRDNLLDTGLLPELAVFPASAPTVAAGTYTACLLGDGDSGNGTLAFTIKGNGSIRGTGCAPDGTAFSFANALHLQDDDESKCIPFYVPLYGKKGGISGLLFHHPSGFGTLPGEKVKHIIQGDSHFLRPVSKGKFHPAGLTESLSFKGGTYFPPTAEEVRPFGFLNPDGVGLLQVFAETGELETTLEENVTLEANGKLVFASRTLKPAVKLNVKNGLVTGSITEPGKKKRTLKGVIVETDEDLFISGMATGATRALTFSIHPPE